MSVFNSLLGSVHVFIYDLVIRVVFKLFFHINIIIMHVQIMRHNIDEHDCDVWSIYVHFYSTK